MLNDMKLADRLRKSANWAEAHDYEVRFPEELGELLREAARRLDETKEAIRAERNALRRETARLNEKYDVLRKEAENARLETQLELARIKENLRLYAARAERAEREVRRADNGRPNATI